MNSIKTAVVVAILLGVLYGVYRVLNIPERPLTPGEQEMVGMGDPDIDLGNPMNSLEPVDSGELAPYNVDLGYDDFKTDALAGNQGSQTRTTPSTSPPVYPDSFSDKKDVGSSIYAPSKSGNPEPEFDPLSPPTTVQDQRDLGVEAFRRAMQGAEEQVQRGRFREALEQLTVFYDAPSLSSEDQQLLADWLDALAGKVIYSSEHALEHPHVVRQGETLEQIAGVYRVPPELLHNINSSKINNPNVLLPGIELKVVRGPFEARISLEKEKLTLFLDKGRYYAGHFPISVGNNPAPRPSPHHYRVKEIFPPEHRNNPYGDWWIDLGSELAIHPITNAAWDTNSLDSIGLTSVDVADLATILEQDCEVLVRR